MSPVHVIVGEELRAEAKWQEAFVGAIDLYRFDRNIEAFERLTVAQAPIDLVILTPAQRGPFNLTADQFIARVMEGPMADSPMLAGLHIIVVGEPVSRTHERVMAVKSLAAAIRLVKFGEIEAESIAKPAPIERTHVPLPAVSNAQDSFTSSFGDNVISKIWAASDAAARDANLNASMPTGQSAPVSGGGSSKGKLFEAVGAPKAVQAPISGGGATKPQILSGLPVRAEVNEMAGQAPVSVTNEPASGLLPALPYQLPNGSTYRGPSIRNGAISVATYMDIAHKKSYMPSTYHQAVQHQQEPASGQRPVPPALASQVQAMVYAPQTQNAPDPMLSWSRGGGEVAPSGGAASVPVPVPNAMPVMMQMPSAMPASVAQAPAQVAPLQVQPATIPTIPMNPPAGVYEGSQAQAAPVGLIPSASASVQADPFVQRAAQSSDVSFG